MSIEDTIRNELKEIASPEFPVKTLEHLYKLSLSVYLSYGKYSQAECREKALEEVKDTLAGYGGSG